MTRLISHDHPHPEIKAHNSLEYSLIDLRLRSAPAQPHPSLELAQQFIDRVCRAQWEAILLDPRSTSYFKLLPEPSSSPQNSSSAIISISNHLNSQDPIQEALVKLAIVATLLSVYVQTNFTGPTFPLQPISILCKPSIDLDHHHHHHHLDEDCFNSSSLEALSLAGEPAYHLTKSASFLLMAIQLLDTLSSSSYLLDQLPTIIWWKLRSEILRRRLFDEPVPLPQALLDQIDSISSKSLLPLNQSKSSDHLHDLNRDLLPMLTLERGLAQHLLGNEKGANILFRDSVSQANLEYELTGILGKKTKFQENEISQLVVLARSRIRSTSPSAINQTNPQVDPKITTSIPINNHQSSMPVTLALNDDTLMEKTQFTQSTDSHLLIDPSNQPTLHPLDQSILLALSLSIKNTSPSHGLTKAQMSPFIERVLENANNWSVHSMALLIRSRLESHRTRTVERGLLQLQALVDQLTKDAENDPIEKSNALERVRWTWSLGLPSRWELERELAQKFSGLGVTRSALEIFERLEMWEHVAQCHLNLDSKPLGIKLVKDLIEDKKIESSLKMSRRSTGVNDTGTKDPKRLGKLWCLLGDLESNPDHWKTAWEVSQCTSSRSMRSLGAHYFHQADYSKSKECLSLALKINPLFTKTWFVYGCASMRTDDWDQAELAFRRCVTLDDEDAESWNNLATVHLKKASMIDRSKSGECSKEINLKSLLDDDDDDDGEKQMNDQDEMKKYEHDRSSQTEVEDHDGTISRPMAAFYALQQAVRFSFDSWKMYTNYMIVAMSVGEYMEAIRALGRIVEIRGEDGLDLEVLKKLMDVVRRQQEPSPSVVVVDESSNSKEHKEKEATLKKNARKSGLTERMIDLMDRVLIPKISQNFEIIELRSELSEWSGDLDGKIKFRLEAYRVGVSNRKDVWCNSSLEEWVLVSELVKRTILNLYSTVTTTTTPDQSNPHLQSSTSSSTATTTKLNSKLKFLLKNFLDISRPSFESHTQFIELEAIFKSLFSTQ